MTNNRIILSAEAARGVEEYLPEDCPQEVLDFFEALAEALNRAQGMENEAARQITIIVEPEDDDLDEDAE